MKPDTEMERKKSPLRPQKIGAEDDKINVVDISTDKSDACSKKNMPSKRSSGRPLKSSGTNSGGGHADEGAVAKSSYGNASERQKQAGRSRPGRPRKDSTQAGRNVRVSQKSDASDVDAEKPGASKGRRGRPKKDTSSATLVGGDAKLEEGAGSEGKGVKRKSPGLPKGRPTVLSEAEVDELISQLSESGGANDKKWLNVLARLRTFRSLAGHCDVPGQFPSDTALGFWVNKQRKDYKRGSLSDVRIRILQSIGFEWEIRGQPRKSLDKLPDEMKKVSKRSEEYSKMWEENLRKLRKYKDTHGDTLVPQRPKSGDVEVGKLGKWVSRMRVHYNLKQRGKANDLSDEREAKLNNLGFSWYAHSLKEGEVRVPRGPRMTWEDRCDQLKQFWRRYRHFVLVDDDEDDFPGLKKFVQNQIREFKRFRNGDKDASMNEEKIRALASIGFPFGTDEATNVASQTYLRKLGINYVDPSAEDRADKHIHEAVSVGSSTGVQPVKESKNDHSWEERFKEFLKYVDEHGNGDVRVSVALEPGETHPHPKLSMWVRNQRRQYKMYQRWSAASEDERANMKEKPTITPERISRLQQAGFPFHGTLLGRIGAHSASNPQILNEKVNPNPNAITNRIPTNPEERVWEIRFSQLCAFRTKHGHCDVELAVDAFPTSAEGGANAGVGDSNAVGAIGQPIPSRINQKLLGWVKTQRKQRKLYREWILMRAEEKSLSEKDKSKARLKPMITAERIARLDEIQFIWEKRGNDTKWEGIDTTKGRVSRNRVSTANNDQWERMFLQLCSYKERNGDCCVKVKNNTECPLLGTWVKTQRRRYKLLQEGRISSMTPERIEKLEIIGFKWVEKGSLWDKRYLELQAWVADHGDAKVPFEKNKTLATWVATQRKEYKLYRDGKNSRMTKERILKLERVGMTWQLRRRKEKNVDTTNEVEPDNRDSEVQAKDTKQQHLSATDDDICEVAAGSGDLDVGMLMYGSALPATPMTVRYKSKTRTAAVEEGTATDDDMSLASDAAVAPVAVVKSAKKRKTTKTDAHAIAKQNHAPGGESASMAPSITPWLEKMEALRHFKAKHGHLRVPNKYKRDPSLGRWVKNLRYEYSKRCKGEPSRLNEDRIRALESEGFVWSTKSSGGSVVLDKSVHIYDPWMKKLDDLKRFKRAEGHCVVPNRFKSDMSLGSWVKAQRWERKKLNRGDKSAMTKERIAILDSLGFNWEPLADELTGSDLWLKRYDELIKYKRTEGDCKVPRKYPANQALGNWVTTQRHQRKLMELGKKSEITADRIKKLDDIGFTWTMRERSPKSWEERVSDLVKFKSKFGHCAVPQKYSGNIKLGKWVCKMRFEYKQLKQGLPSGLNDQKIKELKELGFIFETHLSRTKKSKLKAAKEKCSPTGRGETAQLALKPKSEPFPSASSCAPSIPSIRPSFSSKRRSEYPNTGLLNNEEAGEKVMGQDEKRHGGQWSKPKHSRSAEESFEQATTQQKEPVDPNKPSGIPTQAALV